MSTNIIKTAMLSSNEPTVERGEGLQLLWIFIPLFGMRRCVGLAARVIAWLKMWGLGMVHGGHATIEHIWHSGLVNHSYRYRKLIYWQGQGIGEIRNTMGYECIGEDLPREAKPAGITLHYIMVSGVKVRLELLFRGC